jgi:hypothetical protein
VSTGTPVASGATLLSRVTGALVAVGAAPVDGAAPPVAPGWVAAVCGPDPVVPPLVVHAASSASPATATVARNSGRWWARAGRGMWEIPWFFASRQMVL